MMALVWQKFHILTRVQVFVLAVVCAAVIALAVALASISAEGVSWVSFPRSLTSIRSIHKLRLYAGIDAPSIPWLLPFSVTRSFYWDRHFSPDMLHDSSLCRVDLRIPDDRSLTDGTRDYLSGRMGVARCAPIMGAYESVQFSGCPKCSAIPAVL